MRIWSLHPKYLDSKGLVALWRETLLAKNVLENKTKGYKHHPQLNRFKESKRAIDCIYQYLSEIYKEAARRNYNFNKDKINANFRRTTLTVTRGQVDFEIVHLKENFKCHPLFRVIEGEVEPWEKF